MPTEREAWDARIREAERIAARKRYHPPEEKIEWQKARCPHCGGEVVYSPKEGWDGDLRCPHCAKMFHVARLDEFLSYNEEPA